MPKHYLFCRLKIRYHENSGNQFPRYEEMRPVARQNIHLNGAGQQGVAIAFETKLRERGWD